MTYAAGVLIEVQLCWDKKTAFSKQLNILQTGSWVNSQLPTIIAYTHTSLPDALTSSYDRAGTEMECDVTHKYSYVLSRNSIFLCLCAFENDFFTPIFGNSLRN